MTEAERRQLILGLREDAVLQTADLADELYAAADEIEHLAAEVKRLKAIVLGWDKAAADRGYDIAPLLR